jgi:hypothetical protein
LELDESEYKSFAKENNLNVNKMRLYHDIFKIYDEGEYECVVTV